MPGKAVKWRWASYGLIVGLAFGIGSLLLEGSGTQAPWLPGIVRNLGLSGTLLISGLIGLVAGLIRDRRVA
jgi:hypothetical protein